jgi:hypothetical protein
LTLIYDGYIKFCEFWGEIVGSHIFEFIVEKTSYVVFFETFGEKFDLLDTVRDVDVDFFYFLIMFFEAMAFLNRFAHVDFFCFLFGHTCLLLL